MWQPIETAPKDGSHILLYSPQDVHSAFVGFWKDGHKFGRYWMAAGPEGEACDCAGGWQYTRQPTHWMPLPAAPEGE